MPEIPEMGAGRVERRLGNVLAGDEAAQRIKVVSVSIVYSLRFGKTFWTRFKSSIGNINHE
jgi:hypothetical protein